MRQILFLMAGMCLLVWGAVAYFIIEQQMPDSEPLPTLMVLPSLTPTPTMTATASATAAETPSPTPTASQTPIPTTTFTATATPTLSVRLIQIEAVMPGVILPPTTTPIPAGLTVLPAPPQPIEPLPNATHQPMPDSGWISYESDHPAIQYSAPWEPRQHTGASRGQYHRTDDIQSTTSMTFEGDGLRIRYVAARNMGAFQVVVDGAVIDTVDAYAPELAFPGTRVYSLDRRAHSLIIRSAPERNSRSEGIALSLDAVQVFRSSENVIIVEPPAQTITPSPQPQPVADIKLVAAPPTMQSSATPLAPVELSLSVIIAYDENGNRAVDPAEGVMGIPVRVVEATTNRVISEAFTDSGGYAQLQVVTDSPVRVVVPYFGKVWDVPNSRGGSLRFTHLLAPGNQPGLIP